MLDVLTRVGTSWGTLSPSLLSLARLIFGFLVLRHGMEQVFGYPEASGAALASYEGVLWLACLPGGVLLMLGLYTRPVGLVLAVMWGVYWFVGPFYTSLTEGRYFFGNRVGGDEAGLNSFLFLYLSATGGGAWSLDRSRDPAGEAAADSRWEPYALGILRIASGWFFFNHGLEKWFGVNRSGFPGPNLNLTSVRGWAGLLELTGGTALVLGVFARPMAFLLSGMMAVAYFTSWAPRGFWESFSTPGQNSSIQNCFLFLFLSATSSGVWSVGRAWRHRRERVAAARERAGAAVGDSA